jgi:aminotransferase
MRDRTITISGASKTFSVTGWRLGWAIAPPEYSIGIRRVHDFLTVGAPHPLQMAAAAALELPPTYFHELIARYTDRRDRMLAIVREAGFVPFPPQGAYYVMTDISGFGFADDVACARYLVETIGVAVVPGSSFYPDDWPHGRQRVRFAFPKKDATLAEAAERLRGVRPTMEGRESDG